MWIHCETRTWDDKKLQSDYYKYFENFESLLNNIVNNKKYLYGRNIDHKSISVREYMVYYILLPQQIPIYV